MLRRAGSGPAAHLHRPAPPAATVRRSSQTRDSQPETEVSHCFDGESRQSLDAEDLSRSTASWRSSHGPPARPNHQHRSHEAPAPTGCRSFSTRSTPGPSPPGSCAPERKQVGTQSAPIRTSHFPRPKCEALLWSRSLFRTSHKLLIRKPKTDKSSIWAPPGKCEVRKDVDKRPFGRIICSVVITQRTGTKCQQRMPREKPVLLRTGIPPTS